MKTIFIGSSSSESVVSVLSYNNFDILYHNRFGILYVDIDMWIYDREQFFAKLGYDIHVLVFYEDYTLVCLY